MPVQCAHVLGADIPSTSAAIGRLTSGNLESIRVTCVLGHRRYAIWHRTSALVVCRLVTVTTPAAWHNPA